MLSGRKRVDMYGDEVALANLPGGGHKTKHDEMKNKLVQLMKWAGMDVRLRCEVFGHGEYSHTRKLPYKAIFWYGNFLSENCHMGPFR